MLTILIVQFMKDGRNLSTNQLKQETRLTKGERKIKSELW